MTVGGRGGPTWATARPVWRPSAALGAVLLLAWAGSVGGARGQDQTAVVEGDLTCHPLQHHGFIPPMTVYAREVHTGRTFTVRTRENQERYRIRVAAPGTYVVFSRVWPKDTDRGLTFDVLYSRRVLCGEGRECLDGRPVPVSVRSGQRRGGVDLCSPSPWTTGLVERPGGSPAVLPGSDARSLEEVRAAWRRLLDLRTYRARARAWDDEIVFELERQGQRYALRVVDISWGRNVEGARRETVRIGSHAWESRVSPARGKREVFCWRVHPDAVPFPLSLFPEPGSPAVEEVVSVRRVGDRAEAGDARLVRVYEWRSRLAMVRAWQVGGILDVDRASGLPVRMTFQGERHSRSFKKLRESFTVQYYDFNAPLRVSKPAGC